MSKDENPTGGDYEVGYGKPPKHTRYVPGQSGFKGRKKKPPETQAQIIARARDELVIINGKTMTMFEVMVRSAMNQAAQRGNARELKAVLDLLEKHGAMPQGDWAAEMAAKGDKVLQKIGQIIERTSDVDPTDVALLDDLNAEEVKLVMGCPSCSAELRRRWSDPEYRALRERYYATDIHREILHGDVKRQLRSHRPGKLRREQE